MSTAALRTDFLTAGTLHIGSPVHTGGPARPALVELAPYVAPARPNYGRRRVAAVFVLLLAAAVLAVALRFAVGVLGVVPASDSAGTGRLTPPMPATYTVRPGDTLWSIAHTYRHGGAADELMNRLAKIHGGTRLEVGDVLTLG
jgi:hypothetical protein